MCLILKDQRRVNPSVAKRDITVMKIGYVEEGGRLFHPLYKSSFTYVRNEQTPDEEVRIDTVRTWQSDGEVMPSKTASAGYHAYIDPEHAADRRRQIGFQLFPEHDVRLTLGEFIIPAGSRYFIGDYGDIVASAMTYIGELPLGDGNQMEAKTKEVFEKMKKENKSLR